MDEQHTPETAIHFVFYFIYLIVSLYISWFILWIGIIIISNTYLYFLHCLDLFYLCLTNIILVLFSLIVLFWLCVHIYMWTYIYIYGLKFHISSPIRSRRTQYRRARGGVQSLWSYQRYTAAQRRSMCQLRLRLHKLTGLLASLDLIKQALYTSHHPPLSISSGGGDSGGGILGGGWIWMRGESGLYGAIYFELQRPEIPHVWSP